MTLALLAGLAVFGLMVGSFLNVCIGRIPAGESIVSPGSRCPSCRKPIAWYDNVPVLSYLLLGGRCRSCKTRISLRYPIVEIVTSVLFVLQGLALGDALPDALPLLGARLLFTALLIVLFGTDLDTMRLPDVLTLPGIVAGLVLSLFLPPGIVASLIGAALGAAIPYAIRWIWFRMKGVEAMGLGDVKMLAMIGAFLGWQQVLVVLFLSSLAGALIGVSLAALKGRTLASRLPFGTFLAMGAYAASLWGGAIVEWYAGLYR
jgi:leader peptidase (prepilin peptidase)/N-methyltransferase